MPERNGDEPKAGSVRIGIMMAALFFAATMAWAIPQHLAYGDQAAHKTEQHQRRANDEISRCSLTLTGVDLERCIDQAQATSEERQREERDLEAQRKMALWTVVMGVMAIVGVSLSAVGVVLIWQTWDATLQMAQVTRDTLETERRRERIANQAKANLGVLEITLSRADATRGTFWIKNTGPTSAAVVSAQMALDVQHRGQAWAGTPEINVTELPPSLLANDSVRFGFEFDSRALVEAILASADERQMGLAEEWKLRATISLRYATQFAEIGTFALEVEASNMTYCRDTDRIHASMDRIVRHDITYTPA